ncbi:MAG: hypothetical protein FH748_08770 [Balneolaceae bacterium]|nr:hypothetical protein [Balneolaceae bacterium]
MTKDKKKFNAELSFEGGIERDDRGTLQEQYQKKIPAIFDIADPKKRLFRLRKIKGWIIQDRDKNQVRSSWANEWINLIDLEISKANKENVSGIIKTPKDLYDTRKKRVDRVEEIRRSNQCTYPEAIEKFNSEMEEIIYSSYASFNTQRNKLR